MKASYACLGIQRAAKQSHVCLACLSIFSPHPSRFHSSSARSLCCRFSVAPDANAYAFTSIHPLSHVSLSLSSCDLSCFPSLHQGVQLFFCEPAFSSSAFSCTEKSSLVSSSSQLSSHKCVAAVCEPTSSSLVQSVPMCC